MEKDKFTIHDWRQTFKNVDTFLGKRPELAKPVMINTCRAAEEAILHDLTDLSPPLVTLLRVRTLRGYQALRSQLEEK